MGDFVRLPAIRIYPDRGIPEHDLIADWCRDLVERGHEKSVGRHIERALLFYLQHRLNVFPGAAMDPAPGIPGLVQGRAVVVSPAEGAIQTAPAPNRESRTESVDHDEGPAGGSVKADPVPGEDTTTLELSDSSQVPASASRVKVSRGSRVKGLCGQLGRLAEGEGL